MTDKEKDLEDYKKVLQAVDWGYQYAEDSSVYREGQNKFSHAASLRNSLCLKYPEERDNVLNLWETRGH